MKYITRHIVALVVALLTTYTATAQELEAKVVVKHQKIQGTNTSVLTTLQEAITEFINTSKWTNAQ